MVYCNWTSFWNTNNNHTLHQIVVPTSYYKWNFDKIVTAIFAKISKRLDGRPQQQGVDCSLTNQTDCLNCERNKI